MSEYLAGEYQHLLTEGVHQLGPTAALPLEVQQRVHIVRVRQDGGQLGQWVGTYAPADAVKVAARLVEATGGTVSVSYGVQHVVTLPAVMSAAEFRSLLEMCGHGDDQDAARALSKSVSMIQKMKSGAGRVKVETAVRVRGLQYAYADDRDQALTTAPTVLHVPSDNGVSWEGTGRPARWWRMIAAECYQEYGARIEWQ